MSLRLLGPGVRLLWLGLALAAPVVLAGPYSVGATQSVTHESNLLRVESGQVVPDSLSRSDTVVTTVVQGGIDQPIGRQRVFGNANLRRTRFDRNHVYDNSGYSVAAGADWATVEQVSGSIGLKLQRSLAQFSNDEAGILTHSNIERTRQAESALRWGLSARLSAEAGLTWRSVDFSAPEFASREFRQGSAYVGMRQSRSSAAWWSVGWRQSHGTYPKFRQPTAGSFEPDRFERQELELKATLRPTGATDLDARVGLGRTRYDSAVSRNVSGLFGAIDWTWRPSGRLRLRTHWSRDPSQDSYFLNTLFGRGTLSYDRMATTLQLRADLEASAKTGLYAAWGWTDRSLLRTVEVTSLVQSELRSRDRTFQSAIGWRWQATRSLQFGIDLTNEERRHATDLSRPYHSTSINAFGQLAVN